MARFRRSMSLRPIHRIKHVVDSEGGLVAGAVSVTALADTVDSPVIGSVNQVETGSKINAFYLRIEVLHSSGAGRSNCYFLLFKNVGNNITAAQRPVPNAVGGNDMKRYVIHQEMIMMNGDAGNGQPRTLFNGVISIPRGMRRNGPDDTWQAVLFTPTVAADFCLQAIYKEFK